jgi:hypothetical protein
MNIVDKVRSLPGINSAEASTASAIGHEDKKQQEPNQLSVKLLVKLLCVTDA